MRLIYSIALLALGIPLALSGLAISGLIIFSGPWGLAHGFPLLVITVPVAIIGIRMTMSGRRRIDEAVKTKKSATQI